MRVKEFGFDPFCSEMSLASILGENISLTRTLANVRDLYGPSGGRIASVYSDHYTKWIKTVTWQVWWCLISEGSIHAVIKRSPKNLSPVALLTSIPSHTDKLQVTVLQLKKKWGKLIFTCAVTLCKRRPTSKELNWSFRSYRPSTFLSMLCFKNTKQTKHEIDTDKGPSKTVRKPATQSQPVG